MQRESGRTPVAVAIATVALVASLVAVLLSQRGDPRLPPPAEPSTDPAAIAELEARIDALERSLAEADLAALPESPGPTDDPASLAARVAALEAALQRGNDGAAGEGELADAELERTRRAVAEVRRRDAEAKIGDWARRELDRSDELQLVLGERMTLSIHEQRRLREIFETEAAGYASILDQLESASIPTNTAEERKLGGQWEVTVIALKELRRARDQELEDLLGEERFGVVQQIAKAIDRRPAATDPDAGGN